MPDIVPTILIENDMVRFVRQELVREVRLQDFLPEIEFRPPVTFGIVPKTLHIGMWDESDPKNKKVQFLCELPAGMRTCNYNGTHYTLSMPWTYFLFDFKTSGDPMEGRSWAHTNTRLYWSLDPITGMNQTLMTALVPNVDNHGNICWGSTGIDTTLGLNVRVDRTVHEFFRTTFTHTNGAGSPWQSETGKDDWVRWEEESKKSPAAFRNFPEWDPKVTAAKMPQYMVKYPKVHEIMGSLSDRSRPIEVQGRIPEMVAPATFGRIEEWLKEKLKPEERYRLAVGLHNLGLDDATAIVAPKDNG